MKLNKREIEVMNLLTRGLNSEQIAGHLYCSTRTVEGIRSKLMKRFGAKSLGHLVAIMFRLGLIK